MALRVLSQENPALLQMHHQTVQKRVLKKARAVRRGAVDGSVGGLTTLPGAPAGRAQVSQSMAVSTKVQKRLGGST